MIPEGKKIIRARCKTARLLLYQILSTADD